MINNKLILYFDLDETLISVKLNQEDESKLSTSADEDLCDESEWTLNHPVIQNYGTGGDQYAYEIKAFAREEFKKVFQRIQRINRAALKVIPCILTNASYQDQYIIPCLKKFYETEIIPRADRSLNFSSASFTSQLIARSCKLIQVCCDLRNVLGHKISPPKI
ncbi:MAG: hypothetical protein LW832_09745, partial [Parachlamydia sp.]|nr:hypothetical protein [Parachlamydia sp.]